MNRRIVWMTVALLVSVIGYAQHIESGDSVSTNADEYTMTDENAEMMTDTGVVVSGSDENGEIVGYTEMTDSVSSQSEDTLIVKGVHPWKDEAPVSPDISNWSIYGHAGMSLFDGDFSSEKKHGVYAPAAGLGFMFHFNNTWGIGGEYVFDLYRVKGKAPAADVLLKGIAHNADAYITFDIFNCWRPQNVHKLFALDLMLGGGCGWLKNKIYYPNDFKPTYNPGSPYKYNTASVEPHKSDKFMPRSYFLGGATFEFNVSRSIAVGLRCVYNYYTKDDLDGRTRGNNNDAIFDATAMVRYKIDAQQASHVANFRSKEAFDAYLAEKNAGHEDLVRRSMRDVRRALADGDSAAIAAMGLDYAALTRGDRDTAYLNSSRGAGNYYYQGGDNAQTTIINRIGGSDNYFYVYFKINESKIYDEGLITIQQVADRMKRDNTLGVEIIGCCDNTGSVIYNKALAKKRAKRVAEEMELEHGIDQNRMLYTARGIIQGRRSKGSYSPNRRVEICLVDLEELGKPHEYHNSYDGVYEPSDSGWNNPDGTRVGEEVVTLEYTGREPADLPLLKMIKAEENESLSSLARQYYKNTFCWVYIFLANMDYLPTANSVTENMELRIPKLTKEQKKITREEARDIYYEAIGREKPAYPEE